ncbi:response regulator transcription factor [Pandoraea anhela]|uniref:LuxR family transcriptional regulator n=1 Tax=Pandoraea anhela TaxID=2508295 RepID=A0A5E4U7P9_9BURK|nr:response regulator transcription factor [Pandoraea anhela]VVD95502.1 LuxR family transcriptional regulator [Pandoraea anhela]
MTKIRVAIADPHPVVVAGLMHELGKRTSLEVLGAARSAAGIVDLLNRSPCDVLVTDHTMPGGRYGDGLSLLANVRRMFPCVRILVLTAMQNPAIARQIADLGVASTLCKSRDIDDVIAAIHAAHHGLRHLQRTSTATGALPGLGTTLLSQREVMVLRLYVSGMSINAIAAKVYRTKQTVSAQKRSAMRKLGIESDADLYRFALQTGLSDGEPIPLARDDIADATDATDVADSDTANDLGDPA